MRRRSRRTALIKSNNPHLAGGEIISKNHPSARLKKQPSKKSTSHQSILAINNMFQTHLSFLYFTSIFCISTIHLLCSATDDIFHKILVSLNLVGGFSPLKNTKVNWDYYSQYMESHNPFMFQTTNYRLNTNYTYVMVRLSTNYRLLTMVILHRPLTPTTNRWRLSTPPG